MSSGKPTIFRPHPKATELERMILTALQHSGKTKKEIHTRAGVYHGVWKNWERDGQVPMLNTVENLLQGAGIRLCLSVNGKIFCTKEPTQ